MREPTRPVERRVDNFSEKFDSTTLFYDALYTDWPGQVLLLGPPFANLSPLIEGTVVTALPSGARCDFRIRNMDRHSQMWISVPRGTARLVLDGGLGSFEITPAPNLSPIFEGKRVLFTLSKNNHLKWIQDWARYNRDIHGANAVLFYDNQSTDYSAEQVLEALEAVSGLDQIRVVSWPFKYGPLGFGLLDFWDSNFCQYGALEHARWMYLQRARSGLNSDIDELVVSSKGQSVFEAAERSWSGMVRFHGLWVFGFADRTPHAAPQLPIRHTAFDHYLKPTSRRRFGIFSATDVFPTPSGLLNTKWAVVPCKCPKNAQWTVHGIYSWRGMYSHFSIDRSFLYRHYREVNDNWRPMTEDWQFDRVQREKFDPVRFAYDERMVSNFSRVHWSS